MEYRLLGPLEVLDGGRALPVHGAKQRALLALLLLHANEVVSTDRLLDELWGDDQPASGLTALQVRVSQLRKALGDDASRIETRAPGYVLRLDPGQLDLHRFSRLVAESEGLDPEQVAAKLSEALALWHGPPLADLADEPFARAAVGRMEELRLATLERRIEADLALRRHGDLVGELETLVVEEPFRERLRAQLMLALYRSGRQAEALEAYQDARRSLVDGLGIEPSPALQALERSILQQDPSLELAGPLTPARTILVAVRDASRLDGLLAVAEPLARRPSKELILARPLVDAGELSGTARVLNARRDDLLRRGISARAAAFTSSEPGTDLVRIAVEQDVDLVLVDGDGSSIDEPVVAALLEGAPCDVAVAFGSERRPGPVLVPFVGAEHDWTAVELGAWLADTLGTPLQLAGPREGSGGRDSSRLLASASLAVQRVYQVAAEPLLVEAGTEGVVQAASSVGIAVVGLSDRWRTEALGVARLALVASGRPALLVRRGLRPGGLAPRQALTRFTWTLRA
jgi:DNA-binding SARP family transcriptional activator